MNDIKQIPLQDWILNGWVATDEDGDQRIFGADPEKDRYGNYDAKTCKLISTERFFSERLPVSAGEKRKLVNGVIQEPRPELKVDANVMVWDGAAYKVPRHFKRWPTDEEMDKGFTIVCFTDGRTSFSSDEGREIGWKHYEIVEGD